MAYTAVAESYFTADSSLINTLGGSRGFGEWTVGSNDDQSFLIDLTTTFGPQGVSLFGTQATQLYVSNNGYIYWTDVDGNHHSVYIFAYDVLTHGSAGTSPGGNSTGSNLLWVDEDAVNGTLTFTWDDVGTWPYNSYPPQAFQLQIVSDGSGDAALIFRYEDVTHTVYYGIPRHYVYDSNSNIEEDTFLFGELSGSELDTATGNTGIPGVWIYGGGDLNVAPSAPVDSDATGDATGVHAAISEGHALNTAIGLTASSTDPDADDSVSYSFGFDVNGDPVLTSGLFAIDPTTGVVTLAQAFDYETLSETSVTLTIYATDESGESSHSDFTVNLTNANPSAPTDSSGDAGASVAEDYAGGAIGLDADAADPGGTTVTYHFKDGDGNYVQLLGAFTIDSATGEVTLTGELDYETATSHILTIWASDGAGGESSTDFTVNVTNVAPSAPTDSDGTADTMQENGADGDSTGIVLSATDVHGGDVTYELTDDADGRFKIDALTGAIVATGTVNIDFETAPLSDADGRYYEVTAVAKDPSGASSEPTTFKIYVTNEVEHLFDDTGNGTITDPINFNDLPDGAYDFDDNRYNAGGGNDYVILPDVDTVDAGNPWDFGRTFNAGLGNDVVQGGDGNDSASGGDGNDWLFGGDGNDRLVGSAGNDILAGGDGADKLTGSSGRDIFVFTDSEMDTTKTGEHDVITDFQQGTDKIDLTALYDEVAFGGLKSGKLSGTVSNANKVGFYSEGGKTWIEGDTTGDGIADFVIEMSGSYKLKGSDFVVGSSVISSEGAWTSISGLTDYDSFHRDAFWVS